MRRPDRARPSQTPPREDEPPSSRDRGRKERGSAATQERILDAAETEFAIRGFAGARLREIASGAGIQPALIHHYFVDKQGLYEAVVQRAVEQMSVASCRGIEIGGGLMGMERGIVDVLFEFCERHKQLIAMVRAELVSGRGELVELVREKTHPILEAVVKLTEAFQRAGQLRSDLHPRELVRSGLSLILYPVIEAQLLELLLPEPDELGAAERRKRVIGDVMLSGVRPRSAP